MDNKKYIAVSCMLSMLVLTACNDDDSEKKPSENTQNIIKDTNPYSCTITGNDGSNITVGSNQPGDPAAPEPASGFRTGLKAKLSDKYMVVANNPLATKAGCDVLKAGGSAVDAAIAVQAVLGLVEPQSSTIAGSAFMMYYDAKTKKVTAYDGREKAPEAATEYYLIRENQADNNSLAPVPNARRSGRSIGVPGVMKMFELAHKENGKLKWNQLFDEGIYLSTNGFKVPGRLADAIKLNATNLKVDKEATQTFFKVDGQPYEVGETMTNKAYAETLTQLSKKGADALYTGSIAENIIKKAKQSVGDDEARTPITPSLMTLQDLKNYNVVKREPVCTTYRNYYVCTMPPPSSGGIAVAQTLGILEQFNMGQYEPTNKKNEGGLPNPMGVHLIAEAERLAYADRDFYVADTDFVPLPANGISSLLDKNYLKQRASLINPDRSMGVAQPGNFNIKSGQDKTVEFGTTQFTIVDGYGNVASVTSTVESSMGSFHMVDGFLLSNQLTDFSAQPYDNNGNLIANRVQPNKRPRSTMAPTLVFKGNQPGGEFYLATGSPGGGTIIQYVIKSLVGVLDWNLDAQQAASLPNFGATNSVITNVDTSNTQISMAYLISELEAKGHIVNAAPQSSGVATIVKIAVNELNSKYVGGVDPRREGIVLGNAY